MVGHKIPNPHEKTQSSTHPLETRTLSLALSTLETRTKLSHSFGTSQHSSSLKLLLVARALERSSPNSEAEPSSSSFEPTTTVADDMDDFRVPVHLRDLELPGSWIPADVSGAPESAEAQREVLYRVAQRIQDEGPAVLTRRDEDVLCDVYVLVRDVSRLHDPIDLVRVLCGGLEAAADLLRASSDRDARNAFVMIAFLCHASIVAVDEALVGKKGEWRSNARVDALESVAQSLEGVDVQHMWSMGVVDEAFLLLWTHTGYAALAVADAFPAAHREKAVAVCRAALAAAPESFWPSAAAALVEELVLRGEKQAAFAAEACAHDPSLAGHVLRELARVAADDAKTTNVAKCVAAFVEELAGQAPALIVAHAATLASDLLASPAHALRSAVVASVVKVLEADARRRRTPSEEENNSKPLVTDAARDSLLELVAERRRDASHFARAAALRACGSLVEARALPIHWCCRIADIASDRLRDKSALVRRAALALLVKLLEYNPYHASLDPMRFLDAARRVQTDLDELPQDEEDLAARRRQLEREFEYHRSAADFVGILETTAAPRAAKLLHSPTSGDAIGAARFFGVATAFQLPCADAGLRKVLSLVCSPDDAVRVEAARVIAASVLDQDSTKAARRACDLVAACGHRDLACLEDLVAAELAPKKKKQTGDEDESRPDETHERLTSPRLVRALWDLAASPLEKNSSRDRAAAVRFLAVAATAVGPEVVDVQALHDVTRRLVDSETGRLDAPLAAAVAALVRDAAAPPRERRSKKPPTTSFRRAAATSASALRLALSRPAGANETAWFAAADATLVATFAVDAKPEAAASDLVGRLARNCEAPCKAGALARLLHVAGHVALQVAAAAEDLGVRLKKRCDDVRGDDDLDAALGGADHEARLAAVVEEAVHSGKGNHVVAILGPVAARIVEAGLATDADVPAVLYRAATLALAKLMCVSRPFCEAQLPLLITTLAKATDTPARVTVAVALGDLAGRQPNSLEPWTEHVYAALRDPNTTVRAAVLATLARLALNDMIKAKGGGIADLARCLVDPDPKIRTTATSFFDELARKTTATQSPIYNLLPDVISRLSAARKAGDEGGHLAAHDFHTIMAFLLHFVDKDKHVESLVDKLCQRINATRAEDDAAQAAVRTDLAFCLSKLHLTDKVLRKFVDCFPLYKEALADDDVYNVFTTVTAKARKLPKLAPDLLQLLDDWQTQLDTAHVDPAADDDEHTVAAAQRRSVPPRSTAKKHKAPATSTKKRRPPKSKRVVDDDDDDEPVNPVEAPARIQRTKRSAARRQIVYADDDDDDDVDPQAANAHDDNDD